MKELTRREQEELRRRLDEAKASIEIILRKNFAVPPDMNVEHCVGINIVTGNRIGFTQKQTYLERLGDLYTEGFLTQDEYDHRVEWINSSQTVQQADLVFTDVKNVQLAPKKLAVPKPAVPVTNRRTEHVKMMFFIFSVLAGLALIGVPHLMWFGAGVLVVGFSFAIYQAHQESKRRRR